MNQFSDPITLSKKQSDPTIHIIFNTCRYVGKNIYYIVAATNIFRSLLCAALLSTDPLDYVQLPSPWEFKNSLDICTGSPF